MPGPVNRRASLPGASELFRASGSVAPKQAEAPRADSKPPAGDVPAPSGRVKHDQKITVYFSTEELYALEDATLEMRRRLGKSLDRGRLVRAAVAQALLDIHLHGDDAAIVKALQED